MFINEDKYKALTETLTAESFDETKLSAYADLSAISEADLRTLYGQINPLNFAGEGKPSMYNVGNDMPVPADAFVAESYHDGIHEQFNVAKGYSGWNCIQPAFRMKLDASKADANTVWSGAKVDYANPNYPAAADGYAQVDVDVAVSAFPSYSSVGRGYGEKNEVGYVYNTTANP